MNHHMEGFIAFGKISAIEEILGRVFALNSEFDSFYVQFNWNFLMGFEGHVGLWKILL